MFIHFLNFVINHKLRIYIFHFNNEINNYVSLIRPTFMNFKYVLVIIIVINKQYLYCIML